MKKHHLRYLILFIVVAVLSGELVLDGEPTQVQIAYAECADCGLSRTEVDGMIYNSRHARLDREGQIELFKATFTSDEPGPEDCLPCTEAILEAAGVP